MPSVTSSVTQVFETLSLRGKDKTPPALDAGLDSGLQRKPLELSGALNENKYPRVQLTPAIGVEFAKSVRLSEIRALPQEEQDNVLHDLAITISRNGVVFFQDQSDLTPEDLGRIALRLGELAGKPESSTLHIHPTQELTETGLPLGKISSKPDAEGRQISFADSGLTSKGWHSDVSFEPKPALYTILQMHTLPKTGGDTLWSSNYSAYDRLTPPLQAFLSGLTATHDAWRFREQAAKNGYKLRTAPRGSPENQGDAFKAVHPIVRTNPVTGLNALYVNKTFTTKIDQLSYDESAVLLDYLFRLQHESHDTHVKYHWSKNNVAIWDNSVVNHLATFDFKEYRAGDRAVVVGDRPYFDPAGVSRETFEAQLEKQVAGDV
ncbi:BQ2448_3289 [Microbotryum intermedium]|uniref:BQ2448_3289 protein n=1 Tax=Microbotryum intermedium TaxID=269621 RepID=A0A238FHU6_9BASI|nr:BQ2448_3289 [Microbotryum intermedium]